MGVEEDGNINFDVNKKKMVNLFWGIIAGDGEKVNIYSIKYEKLINKK